jgi:hypothetical protein
MLTNGYMKIKDVIMGMPNAYHDFETKVLGMESEKYQR